MLTSEILLGSARTRSWTLLPHPYSWGCAGTRPKYPQTHSSSFLCSILYPGDDKDPGPCSLSLPSVRLCSASGRWCQGVAGGGRGSRGTSLPHSVPLGRCLCSSCDSSTPPGPKSVLVQVPTERIHRGRSVYLATPTPGLRHYLTFLCLPGLGEQRLPNSADFCVVAPSLVRPSSFSITSFLY